MQEHILTYTKKKFTPLNPRIEDIDIRDIAHALSLMTRANGHFPHFYSVAQHSINCYKEAKARNLSKRTQLGCLLHDASESYLSDITRPVKAKLTQYHDFESQLQTVIYERFGLGDLTEEEAKSIKAIDDTMLYHEFLVIMGEQLWENNPEIKIKHDFSQRDFKQVEKEFLYLAQSIGEEKPGWRCVVIDGCRGGWIAVSIAETGFEADMYHNVREIITKYSDADSFFVDIPMGLPESDQDQRPDTEARTYLSGRGSCIFNVPCRQAVYEEDYKEASEINRIYLGKGLSKQSFAICNQIRELDVFLAEEPEYKERLMESHPEICFAVLASQDSKWVLPLYNSKHTEEGYMDRIDVMEDFYDKTDEFIEAILKDPILSKYQVDCIDALCLAVSARMSMVNGMRTIPEVPEKDVRGIPMRIVYGSKKML
jgi:predicted RNase H-like nuclease/5'-deoxynucleotidase YfbR-like HD superfamily hydrolase